MRYFEAKECSNAVADPLVTSGHDLKGIDAEVLTRGRSLEGWDASSWLKATQPDDDGDPDDVLQNHLGLPIFSARLRDALEHGGIGGIQYLRVRVLRPDDSEVPGFAIANLLNLVAGLQEQSDYERFPSDYFLPQRRGAVRGVRKVVLKWGALKEMDVFRLEEFPLWIGVSERFKEIFEDQGFTGYSFEPVRVTG